MELPHARTCFPAREEAGFGASQQELAMQATGRVAICEEAGALVRPRYQLSHSIGLQTQKGRAHHLSGLKLQDNHATPQ